MDERRGRGRLKQVTVRRNDVRTRGFKRWTVYCGGEALFDIEATSIETWDVVKVRVVVPKDRADATPGDDRNRVLDSVDRKLRG